MKARSEKIKVVIIFMDAIYVVVFFAGIIFSQWLDFFFRSLMPFGHGANNTPGPGVFIRMPSTCLL